MATGDEWKTSDTWRPVSGPDPEDLRLGTYSLGFPLLDLHGRDPGARTRCRSAAPAAHAVPRRGADAASADPASPEAPAPQPRLAAGEWATDITITVGSDRDARKQAGLRLAEARVHAADGLCEKTWPAFKNATRHILRDLDWRERKEPLVREELAGCYIDRARNLMKRVDKADALEAARRWDRHHPDLDAEVQPLADELEAEAAVLADEGQWSAAYLTYARVKAGSRRSWTRRAAEQARDESWASRCLPRRRIPPRMETEPPRRRLPRRSVP